jgi:CRISPR/Cas system CSM-associated protein Csm3 (group 7 of RAMP superfamily)
MTMSFRAITATLELRTPLHVGTGEGTETVDDLLHRDARGRLLIPGTTLAGALRSIATRLAPRFPNEDACLALTDADPSSSPACKCLTCQLFGTVNPKDEDRRPNESEQAWLARCGNAARLLIYDTLPDKANVQVRDGVGIDRVTGAAARRERSKFDLEILPAQTKFQLRIEIDNKLYDNNLYKESKRDRLLQLLAATLAEWQAGRGAVGGRVGRGLGALALKDVRWIEQDLNQQKNLIDFLTKGPQWQTQQGNLNWIAQEVAKARPMKACRAELQALPVARSWALAEFTLAATGPFLTHDLVQAGRSGFDHAPVLAAYQKGSRPVLPGSSLRGVLRSQAERIARTLTTLDVWESESDSSERSQRFGKRCSACNPLTAKTSDPVASCNSLVKGHLRSISDREERRLREQAGVADKLCLGCYLFGSTWNGSRLRVEDAPLMAGTEPVYKALDFVAIDRFTGGGRDSAKFDATVLWQPKFSVRLFLDNPEPWELGWLALTLRDLHDGLATVGYGAAKGFGRCEIKQPSLTLGVLHDSDFPLPTLADDQALRQAVAAGEKLRSHKVGYSGLYQTVAYASSQDTEWLTLANGWVSAFNQQVKGHQREDDLVIRNDSYFIKDPKSKQWLSDLYPARVA